MAVNVSSLCHRCSFPLQARQHSRARPFAVARSRIVRPLAQASEQEAAKTQGTVEPQQEQQRQVEVNVSSVEIDKEVTKFARNAATTFAPRASGATGSNPATKGSLLYTIFDVQAWVGLAVGGLLSFNVLFPSDQPDIARLLGMWSIWMFTIPSLRARECTPAEKDALNLLFLLVPLINVGLPFIWKSFPFIYSADCVALAAVFAWKGLLPGQEQQSTK